MIPDDMPIISVNPAIQSAYEEMRVAGTSHNLAEMFALRQAPTINTDNTFMSGHCNGSQFEANPAMGDFYRRECEAAGGDTTGKVYMSQLADFPGDPQAWVSGRGDVQRICEQRGWGCSGDVTVKRSGATDLAPEPDTAPLATDIVDKLATEMVQSGSGASMDEAREAVREKHTPSWAKE